MKKFAVFAIAGLLFAASADAALFWHDDFNYADGDLTVYDGTGDDVSGGLWTPHSGTGFPTSVVVSSQQAILRQGNPASEDVNRLTGTTLAAGETLYAAFKFSVQDLRAGVESFDGDEIYFAHFRGDFKSRVHLRDAIGGGGYTLGLSGSSGAPASIWGSDLAFDTQYIGVISYEFDTGVSKLWVNPANEASASISDTTAANSALNAFALRQDFVSAGDHAIVSIDWAATGSTFADVIPEPASLALLALGGLTIIRRRK